MRSLIIVFIVLLALAGCKTNSYFTSANNLANEDCQVVLVNGTEISGKLTIQFETGNNADRFVKIQTGKETEQKILISDILYYRHKGDLYFPKETNLEAYIVPAREKIYTPNVNNLLFMKRLTAENAKIQLFQLYKSRRQSPDGIDQYDYYISLKEENRFVAKSIRGHWFFPDFEVKMSEMVADCPGLAQKIRDKDRGYTVRQISVDAKKNEVVRRIVEEYNNCR